MADEGVQNIDISIEPLEVINLQIDNEAVVNLVIDNDPIITDITIINPEQTITVVTADIGSQGVPGISWHISTFLNNDIGSENDFIFNTGTGEIYQKRSGVYEFVTRFLPTAIFSEVLSGTINGTNATFMAANNFSSDSVSVFLNGLQLLPIHYTVLLPYTVILNDAPGLGDIVTINYSTIIT